MSDYNLGTARGAITIDGSQASAGFGVAQTAASTFFGAVQNKVKSVQAFGRKLAAIGAGGVAGFGLAVKAASSFEFQMSAVQAVSNATGKEMDALRKKALQLGADTQFSASESASAMEELVKAGLSVDDVLNGAADATVALAAAGGIALPEAAIIASNAMNQFGLSSKEVVNVADLLAGAANASATDVGDLGTALSQVGAVANLAGLSLDDTVTALGEMANAGIKGSDAGTSLKTMLTNLIPSTDQQIAKFRELGLMTYDANKAMRILSAKGIKPVSSSFQDVRKSISDYIVSTGGAKAGTQKLETATDKFIAKQGIMSNKFFDSKGNIKDLRGLQDTLGKSLETLSDGTTKMTREEKLKNIEVLFGTDAMRAAGIAATLGADGYDKFSAKMKGITAADVARKRMDNLKGSVEQLRGATETLAIKVGTPLLGPIRSLVKGVTSVVSAIGRLPQPILNAVGVLGAIASIFLLVVGAGLALLPILLGLFAHWVLMKIVSTLVQPVFALAKALIFQRNAAGAATVANRAFATSVATIGRYSKIAAIGVKLLGLAVRVLAFAFSGPGLAIAALVIGLILLYKNFKPFRDLVNSVGAALGGLFAAGLAKAKVLLGQLAAYGQKLGAIFQARVLPVIKQVGAALQGKILAGASKIVGQIKGQLVPALAGMVGAFTSVSNSAFGKKLGEWGAAAGGLAAKILPFLAKMGEMFVGNVLPILVKVAGFFGGIFISTIVSAISGVISVITGLVKVITGVVNVVKGILTGDWALVWQGLKQIVSGAFQAILGAIKVYFAVGILKLFKLGFTLLRGIVTAGWGLLKTLFMGGIKGIFNIIKGGVGLYVGIWKAIFTFIGVIVRAGINLVKLIFTQGLTLIVNGLRMGLQALVFIWKSVFTLIWATIRMAFGIIRAIFTGAIAAIRGIFTGGLGALRGIVRSVFSAIVSIVRTYINIWRSIISTVISTIRAIVSAGFRALRGIISGALSAARGAVVSGFNGMVSFIKGIPGKIKGAFSGAKTMLSGIGKSIIDGLVAGIKNATHLITGAISAVKNKIKNGLADALKVNSPSKLTIPFGSSVVEGLEVGAIKRTKNLAKAMKTVADVVAATKIPDLALSAAATITPLSAATVQPSSVSIAGPLRAALVDSNKDKGKQFILKDAVIEFRGGKKWVSGIVKEVNEGDAEFDNTQNRTKKP